jgi:hypothetical protein
MGGLWEIGSAGDRRKANKAVCRKLSGRKREEIMAVGYYGKWLGK